MMSFEVIIAWEGQPRRPETGLGQRTRAGGHDSPAIRRQFREQPQRAWKQNHAFEVIHFAPFDFVILGGVIGVGQVFADRGQAGTSVGARDNLVRIKAVFNRPAMPHPGNGASGVDQYAVQVE